MRILHVITTIERGGAEKQLLILVREQIKSGLNVSILYLNGLGSLRSEFERIGANVIGKYSNKLFILQLLFGFFQCKNYDIIHSHLPKSEIYSSIVFFKKFKVITRHNAEPFFPRKNIYLSRLLSRIFTLNAKVIIAISHTVHDYLRNSKEISTQKKIVVIYYGYDISNAKLTRSKNEIPIILTIARLVNQKNLFTLLDAYSQVRKEMNCELLIIGDGVLKNELVEYAHILGISKNVTWLGRIDNVNNYLSQCDVFTLTSYYEGFGLVLLEALQQECAIVASNVSAIPEVLGADFMGLFNPHNSSELKNKLIFALDPLGNSQLKKMGSLRLNLFLPSKMNQQLMNVYSLYISNMSRQNCSDSRF